MPPPRPLNKLLVLVLALLPALSWALGLGGIRSYSALNEPFLGLIELNDVSPEELDGVKVLLGSEAEFSKAGSPRHDFLTGLTFLPEVTSEGKLQVRVTSLKPIREPFLDFLVEVTWPQGRLVKGFTVLLDPPTTQHRSPPPTAAPKSVPPVAASVNLSVIPPIAPSVQPPISGRQTARPLPQAPLQAPGITLPSPPVGYPLRYGPVPSGANLSNVARRMAPQGASQAQTALAIYRANPQAFSGGNINKLKAGSRLEIPHPYLIFAYDAEAAKQQFLAAQHLQPLPDLPAVPQDRLPSSGADPVQDRLEIATQKPELDGDPVTKLPLSASRTPPGSPLQPEQEIAKSPTLAPELALVEREILLVREMAESGRQETADLRGRIGRLEDHLADIKRLLELSNTQLAQLQGAGAHGKDGGPVRELEPALGDKKPLVSQESGNLVRAPVQQPRIGALSDASKEGPPDREAPASMPSATVITEAPAPGPIPALPETSGSALPAVTQPADKEPGTPAGVPVSIKAQPASQIEAASPPRSETQIEAKPAPVAKGSPARRLAVETPPPEPPILDDLASWALVAGGPLLILLLGLLILVRRQNQTKEASGETEELTMARGLPTGNRAPVAEAGESNRLASLIARVRDSSALITKKPNNPEALPQAFLGSLEPERVASQSYASSAPVQATVNRAPGPGPTPVAGASPKVGADVPPAKPQVAPPVDQAGPIGPATAEGKPLTERDAKADEDLDTALEWTLASAPPRPDSQDLGVSPELTLPEVVSPAPIVVPGEGPQELDLSDLEGRDLSVPSDLKRNEPALITPDEPQEALDLMTPSLGNLELTPQAPSPASEPAPDLTAGDFDLDLEGLDMLVAAPKVVEGDKLQEPLVDLDLNLDELMDLDLSSFASTDLKVSRSQTEPSPTLPLDWGDLALTLEQEEPLPEGAPPEASPADADFPADFERDSGSWDEVGIKLDLARAYLQMDDPEAAILLLTEVIAEGTAEQIAEAKTLRASLG